MSHFFSSIFRTNCYLYKLGRIPSSLATLRPVLTQTVLAWFNAFKLTNSWKYIWVMHKNKKTTKKVVDYLHFCYHYLVISLASPRGLCQPRLRAILSSFAGAQDRFVALSVQAISNCLVEPSGVLEAPCGETTKQKTT